MMWGLWLIWMLNRGAVFRLGCYGGLGGFKDIDCTVDLVCSLFIKKRTGFPPMNWQRSKERFGTAQGMVASSQCHPQKDNNVAYLMKRCQAKSWKTRNAASGSSEMQMQSLFLP